MENKPVIAAVRQQTQVRPQTDKNTVALDDD
jgi:hypothetical protein